MSFSAGQILLASQLNAQADVSNADATSRTTTSTAYTTTLSPATICGIAFVAPPSGKVKILWNNEASNSGASFTLTSPQVATGSTVGSGTVVLAADDARTTNVGGTTSDRHGASTTCTGLTPGDTYNVALYHRVGSGTGTFLRREVIVSPSF
jgi:hypothetical protein